jgi:hypothetical protein
MSSPLNVSSPEAKNQWGGRPRGLLRRSGIEHTRIRIRIRAKKRAARAALNIPHGQHGQGEEKGKRNHALALSKVPAPAP